MQNGAKFPGIPTEIFLKTHSREFSGIPGGLAQIPQKLRAMRETVIQGHSKVIRCCANKRGTYDFLLTLHSNLTSIFQDR